MARIYITKGLSDKVTVQKAYQDLPSAISDFVGLGVGDTINITVDTFDELYLLLEFAGLGYKFTSRDITAHQDSIEFHTNVLIESCEIYPGIYKKSHLAIAKDYRGCPTHLMIDDNFIIEPTGAKMGDLTVENLVLLIVVGGELKENLVCYTMVSDVTVYAIAST